MQPSALYLVEGDMQNLANITVSSSAPLERFTSALDSVNEQLWAGRIAGPLAELIDHLSERRENGTQGWPAYARFCLSHPVCDLLYQDPFTVPVPKVQLKLKGFRCSRLAAAWAA
jgi:hypothetical protein